jgi:hypothetical protein
MKQSTRIAVVIAGCLLVAAPAVAFASPGNGNGPKGPTVEYAPGPPETPGPKSGLPEKAKAYGRYCQDQSKKHVDGQKGTPFSQCVTAMAKAAHDERLSARQACKGLSKKHVKGVKGTPFSKCVQGVAKLRS